MTPKQAAKLKLLEDDIKIKTKKLYSFVRESEKKQMVLRNTLIKAQNKKNKFLDSLPEYRNTF